MTDIKSLQKIQNNIAFPLNFLFWKKKLLFIKIFLKLNKNEKNPGCFGNFQDNLLTREGTDIKQASAEK